MSCKGAAEFFPDVRDLTVFLPFRDMVKHYQLWRISQNVLLKTRLDLNHGAI
jgi:hypothetical protein